MTMRFDRRQFLLASAAATGALALGGCAAWRRARAPPARARSTTASSRACCAPRPRLATGLGLDTGERAYLQEPAQRFRRRPARWAAIGRWSTICRALRRIDRAGLPPRERAWLDTVALARRARSSDVGAHPLRHVRRLSRPLCDLAADRLLSERPRLPRQPAQDRDPRRCRGLCRAARGLRRATSTSRSSRPAPMPAAASSRPTSSSTRR